ncbi:hypothetical protein P3X46_028192 [Hevea brasiliensis]|uniref:Uncharacterized protein n=1 Tax=Hevea brasiliensis TaxID=3981 RepID=A0ABQ9KRI3_HEVBR|nr:hypothetical protein P3X46_028192 [Hevea brasiliensis]
MNPRENASAILLRSGKEVDNQAPHEPKKKQGEQVSKVPEVEVSTESKLNKVNNAVLPPFPCRLAKNKKEEQEKEILETFRKVEVNIPLLDAIKQVPKYAKFLKELCTTKRKLRNNEKISVGENVSALIQQKLLPKCKDPETSVIIQLADHSNAYPLGVVEDVLVQVGELIFPADFYILDMEDSIPTSKSALILFGRPFLKTAKTKIDVDDGTLTMEFNGETVKFNIFDAMKYPADDHFVFSIDVVDTIVQDVFELSMEDELEVVISQGIQEISTNPPLSVEVQEAVMALQSLPPAPKRYEVSKIDLPVSHTKLLPSVVQAPALELKILCYKSPPPTPIFVSFIFQHISA